MIRHNRLLAAGARPLRLASTLGLAIALAACGGGGSSGSSNATSTDALSGTAATGNAIGGGTVTLKDSLGNTVTTTTDLSGHYSFSKSQISGLTAPFMLEISYTVGGVSYTLHSAVSAQDASSGNATVNITPLTELLIANIAQDLPANFFKYGSYTGKLSNSALTAGVSVLDAILANVLSGLGLSGSLDLLHNKFSANGTGLDSLLDALKISIDPVNQSVTITNTLNGKSVTGSITSLPAGTLDASGSAAVTDIQGIEGTFELLHEALAKNPTSVNTSITGLFDGTNFLNDGETLSQFASDILSDRLNGSLGNITFTDFTLRPVPAFVTSANVIPSGKTAWLVGFTVLKFNVPVARQEMVMYKNSNGLWIALGNQRKAMVGVNAIANSSYGNVCAGLQFDIEDLSKFTLNSSAADISYAVVTGPGLPANGLMFFRNSGGGMQAAAVNSTYNGSSTSMYINSCGSTMPYTLSDNTIAGMSLPADYTFTLHHVAGDTAGGADTTLATYSERLHGRPFTSTQLANGVFPSGVTASPSLLGSAKMATPTPVTVSWTAPTLAGELADTLMLTINSSGNPQTNFYYPDPTAHSVSLTPPAIASASSANVSLSYTDNFLREIIYNANGPQ